jgi:hypothetical protein
MRLPHFWLREEYRQERARLPVDDGELSELVRKIALLNAVKHDGKAQNGPVIGTILGEKPEFRTKVNRRILSKRDGPKA